MRDVTDNGRGWRQEIIKQHSDWCAFLDPCRHNTPPSAQIVEQDKRDIECSDAVLAHVHKYSAGTLMEIFFGFAVCDKPVVVVAPIQFHDDQWLIQHCNWMTTSLDEAMDFLMKKLF